MFVLKLVILRSIVRRLVNFDNTILEFRPFRPFRIKKQQRSSSEFMSILSTRSHLRRALSRHIPHFPSLPQYQFRSSSNGQRRSSSNGQRRSGDIYTRLIEERIVFLNQPIEDAVASNLVAQLLFLEAEDSSAPISLILNSPGQPSRNATRPCPFDNIIRGAGGSVTAGFAIYDTVSLSSSPSRFSADSFSVCVCLDAGKSIWVNNDSELADADGIVWTRIVHLKSSPHDRQRSSFINGFVAARCRRTWSQTRPPEFLHHDTPAVGWSRWTSVGHQYCRC